MKQNLADIGIPVQAKDQTHVNNQFRLQLRKVTDDIVGQCDMFHIAKHAIKFIGYTHEYDISSLPIDKEDTKNTLIMNISGLDLHETNLQNILFFAPNVNSLRRIKVILKFHFNQNSL
jgi:glutamine synthetase